MRRGREQKPIVIWIHATARRRFMSNRFYLASSVLFVVGGILAIRESATAVTLIDLSASLLFFLAAFTALRKQR